MERVISQLLTAAARDSAYGGSCAQIGNAVLPLLGQAILAHLAELLGVGEHDAMMAAA